LLCILSSVSVPLQLCIRPNPFSLSQSVSWILLHLIVDRATGLSADHEREVVCLGTTNRNLCLQSLHLSASDSPTTTANTYAPLTLPGPFISYYEYVLHTVRRSCVCVVIWTSAFINGFAFHQYPTRKLHCSVSFLVTRRVHSMRSPCLCSFPRSCHVLVTSLMLGYPISPLAMLVRLVFGQ
jgi:hypothetical protein